MPEQWNFAGTEGNIVVWHWPAADPRFEAFIAHGIGEHARRYDHVAERLLSEGAEVYAPDHLGHGRSAGERALVRSIDHMAADLRTVVEHGRQQRPGVPAVLIGHSLGGIIATRFVQLYPGLVDSLVLSAPAIGGNPAFTDLAKLAPIPEVPIDGAMLSRDPEVGRAYLADPDVHHGGLSREFLTALVEGVEQVASGPGFGDLPTLWVHGSDDPLVPYAVTAAAMDRLRGDTFHEIVYPQAKHEVFNEINKQEVLDAVVEHILSTLPLAADQR